MYSLEKLKCPLENSHKNKVQVGCKFSHNEQSLLLKHDQSISSGKEAALMWPGEVKV